MSHMSEREIMVANGEACPCCLSVYPAPTAHAETVTCGTCEFVNQFSPPASSDADNVTDNPKSWIAWKRHAERLVEERRQIGIAMFGMCDWLRAHGHQPFPGEIQRLIAAIVIDTSPLSGAEMARSYQLLAEGKLSDVALSPAAGEAQDANAVPTLPDAETAVADETRWQPIDMTGKTCHRGHESYVVGCRWCVALWKAAIEAQTESRDTTRLAALSEFNGELIALVRAAVAVLVEHAPPDGLTDHDAMSRMYGIFDGPEYRALLAKAETL